MPNTLAQSVAQQIYKKNYQSCLALPNNDGPKALKLLLKEFMALTQPQKHAILKWNLNAITCNYPANLLQSIWWNSPQGVEALPTDLESLSDKKLCVRSADDFTPLSKVEIRRQVVDILCSELMPIIEDDFIKKAQIDLGYVHIKHEELKETFDSLINLTSTYKGSRRFLEFLNFTSKIKNYSAFNVALIHAQNPNVEYVATSNDWERRHKRKVKANAKPIVILAPFHPILMVFDVNDTDGAPLPNRCFSAFWAEGYEPYEELETLVDYLGKEGVKVTYEDLSKNLAGCITRNIGKTPEYSMKINENHAIAVRFATVIHEIGHWLCGHLGKAKGVPNRAHLDLAQKEFEAESVSYVVCKRFGIRSNSEEYLADYVDRQSLIPSEVSVDLILKAASKIETLIKSGPSKKERSSNKIKKTAQLGFELVPF